MAHVYLNFIRPLSLFVLVVSTLLTGCGSDGDDTVSVCSITISDVDFTNEELITINDYFLDAMEPDISFDDEILMFNDREQSGPENKNMHWASRITDTEYQYQGEIDAINTDGVDGTPTFDASDRMYYTSTGDFMSNGFKSFYQAQVNYVSGGSLNVSNIELVEDDDLYQGFDMATLTTWISVDPDISSNGEYMFYSLFEDNDASNTLPEEIDIKGTISDGADGFTPLDDSIFVNVNTTQLDYAPTISNNGLEMYFTRADLTTSDIIGIFKATRNSTTDPFAVEATTYSPISGVVEAPAFNGDQTALYYHRKASVADPVYQIYRVTRDLPVECR